MPDPVIRVHCSLELLQELHVAHEALQRAKARQKASGTSPALERLIVAVASARLRQDMTLKLEAPPDGPAAA